MAENSYWLVGVANNAVFQKCPKKLFYSGIADSLNRFLPNLLVDRKMFI